MRGWPNIFWAVYSTSDAYVAVGLLVSMILIGALMLMNMFPAIFIASLRKEEERIRKKDYLRLYVSYGLCLGLWILFRAMDIALVCCCHIPHRVAHWKVLIFFYHALQ